MPEPPRFGQRLQAGGAAIDRHQQCRALAGERADRFDIGPVALENPVGNVDQRIEPAMAQIPGQQRRRGGAVDIVVAEDRDLLRRASPRPRCAWPRPPSASPWRDRASVCGWSDRDNPRPRRSRRRAPPAPAPAFRQLITLRDRQRPRCAARIEPVAPQLSGRGLRDAEKCRRRFDGQCGCGQRHDALAELERGVIAQHRAPGVTPRARAETAARGR